MMLTTEKAGATLDLADKYFRIKKLQIEKKF